VLEIYISFDIIPALSARSGFENRMRAAGVDERIGGAFYAPLTEGADKREVPEAVLTDGCCRGSKPTPDGVQQAPTMGEHWELQISIGDTGNASNSDRHAEFVTNSTSSCA
jgi:hypothetical protein